MKRTVSVFLSLIGAAAFGDITGPGVYELNPGDDINAQIEWLDAQPGASDYLQTIILNPGTYTIDNEVMMTNKVVICGKTGNPADVIVDVQGLNKAFCLDNAEAVLHSLTVMNGLCTGTGSYGVIRIVQPNGRGNTTNTTKKKGVGGVVSNVVCTACQTSGKRAAGVIYVDSDNGLATHCIVQNCAGARQRDDGRNHGIFLYVEAGAARNCLVADNDCTVQWVKTPSETHFASVAVNSGTIVNCTVVGNKMMPVGSNIEGTDIACAGVLASGGKVVNTLVFGNNSTSTLEHYSQWSGMVDCFLNCALDTDEAINETCLAVTDPGFVDSERGDYRLMNGSVCENRGTTDDAYDYGVTDLAGLPRFRNVSGVDKIDIGAYQCAAVTALNVTYELLSSDFDSIPVHVSVEASGFGDSPMFYYDFKSDGTPDLVSPDDDIVHTLGVGTYRLTVTASNVTEGVGQSLTCAEGFSVLAHPVHYVDVNSKNPVVPYSMPGTAATDIQSALDIAVPGAEVVILPGLYEVSQSLYVTNDYLNVHGVTGNPEDVVVRAVTESNRCMQVNAGAHTIVHSLVLENGRCGSGIEQPVTMFAYGPCLNIANIVQRDAQKRGYETLVLANAGQHLGGTVSNCVIRGGSIGVNYSRAGGVFLYGPNAHLTHCVITNNVNEGDANANGGWFGATGLHLSNGARADHCLIAHNLSGANSIYQSAVFVGADSVLRYSTVTDNDCAFVGGVNVAESGRFEKCVIADNRVTKTAAATSRRSVWGAFDYPTEDTTASRYVAKQVEQDCATEAERATTAEVYGRQTMNASDVAVADVGLGAGSVFAEARVLFSKPAQGDYSPRAGSPSAKVVPVDSETDMPAVDLLGKPRASGGAYDLGAYQHQASGLMILFR